MIEIMDCISDSTILGWTCRTRFAARWNDEFSGDIDKFLLILLCEISKQVGFRDRVVEVQAFGKPETIPEWGQIFEMILVRPADDQVVDRRQGMSFRDIFAWREFGSAPEINPMILPIGGSNPDGYPIPDIPEGEMKRIVFHGCFSVCENVI
ncbi:MAG: hypothetical protein F4Z15_11975 [Gammaproteobacteria bacterium]|nr:hypothetical protein [Gammaproteobacteria bacterium]